MNNKIHNDLNPKRPTTWFWLVSVFFSIMWTFIWVLNPIIEDPTFYIFSGICLILIVSMIFLGKSRERIDERFGFVKQNGDKN